MTAIGSNRLVRDYLDELGAATRDLPRLRRDELLHEIEEHISDALVPEASEAEIRIVLDRLGDPGQITAEERDRLGIARPRPGFVEWAAVVLLPIGGVLLPVLGWVVGVVLLWASRVWTVRDKLIGTLLVPGGLLPAIYLSLAPVQFGTEVCEAFRSDHTVVTTCSTSPTAMGRALGIVVVAVLALIPILTRSISPDARSGRSCPEHRAPERGARPRLRTGGPDR